MQPPSPFARSALLDDAGPTNPPGFSLHAAANADVLFDVPAILEAEAWRATRHVFVIRVAIALLALVNVAAVWSANARAHMVSVALVATGYLVFGAWGLALVRRRRWRQVLAVAGVVVDTLTVTLFSLASLHNHSGAYETLLAPLIGMLYMMFSMLTALQHSVRLSLGAAVFAAAQRALVVAYVVGTGQVRTSPVATYGEGAVNLDDQVTILAFIVVSGAIAAWASHSSRRALLTAAREAQQRAELQRREDEYRKYLSTQVIDHVLERPDSLALSGVRRRAVVLCASLVDLARRVEELDPEAALALLNEHLSALVAVVFRYGGTLDKFTEVGVVAVFGLPCELPDPAGAATRAALEMWEGLGRASSPSDGAPAIAVGIAEGVVVAGNVGAPERMEYTVIGRARTRAFLLAEAAARVGRAILVDATVQDAVRGWASSERVQLDNDRDLGQVFAPRSQAQRASTPQVQDATQLSVYG